MRESCRRNIGAGLACECFKAVTKIRSWLFSRPGAINPMVDVHTAINRNQAGIGIEAKREEENNKEEREQFWKGSHNNDSTLKNLFSK